MERNIEMLHTGNYSCVISNNGDIRTFTQHGITDLYDLLNNDLEFLNGACIADKVIGKGAAALIILGGVSEIYADIISASALGLLLKHNIKVEYVKNVAFIENRNQTDWCPIERMCYDEETPETIYPLIKEFITKMRSSKSI